MQELANGHRACAAGGAAVPLSPPVSVRFGSNPVGGSERGVYRVIDGPQPSL